MTDTEAREKFLAKLNRWAFKRNYTRQGGIWRAADHYLCPERTPDGNFIVGRRAYESGALIGEHFTV